MADAEPTIVYTDGACSGNPGPGGWAWAESTDRHDSGGAAQTTNNRMELTAVDEAIRSNPGSLVVVTDSTYVKNGLEKWSKAWVRNGWRTKDGKEVKNRDLWEPLVAAVVERPDLEFRWVKGHSGDLMNDLADRLAVAQRDAHRPGGGVDAAGAPGGGGSLADLDPAAQRLERRRRDGRIPDGHLLAVFGQAPPELGGWDANPLSDGIRRRLTEILAAKHEIQTDLVVLSGLRQGAEQLGAEAAIAAGVPLVAVLPYPDPERVWPEGARVHFVELCEAARDVVVLERKRPADREAAGKALGRRDSWLVHAVDEAVLVWDRDDGRYRKLHGSLERRLGDDLWVVEPG